MADTYIINSVVLQCDTPNQNGRIYPKAVVEKAMLGYLTKIQSKTSIGCFVDDIQKSQPIDISKASHIITRTEIVGDKLIADAKILKTPKGQILESMIADPNVHFLPRGYGIISPTGIVSSYILDSISIFIETPADKAKQTKVTAHYNYDRAMGVLGKR